MANHRWTRSGFVRWIAANAVVVGPLATVAGCFQATQAIETTTQDSGGGATTSETAMDGTAADTDAATSGTVSRCDDRANGTPCGPARVCHRGTCVVSRCGDAVADSRTEACDDGNDVPSDGCEADCTRSCKDDTLARDDNPCNGTETCDPDSGLTKSGAPLPEGEACQTETIQDGKCRAGGCVVATCGNTKVDGLEQCDDGNLSNGDGCDVDCTLSCLTDPDCDDGDPCTGVETCDRMVNVCQPGEPEADGLSCALANVPSGSCKKGRCISDDCGNAKTDPGEQCDDGNDVGTDGCDVDCTFSCTLDAECDDGNPCNGAETCNPEAHTCGPGLPKMCPVSDPCHKAECDPARVVEGLEPCFETLIDTDRDGEAPSSAGPCGTDCDDTTDKVSSHAAELCGNQIDDDCNPKTEDGTLTTYYADCDGDGFAGLNASYRESCNAPTEAACPVKGSAWTTRAPNPTDASTYDCNDALAIAFPGQTAYFTEPGASGSTDDETFGNYDCDKVAQRTPASQVVNHVGTCSPYELRGFVRCSASGWIETAAPKCGASGAFVECGNATSCTPGTKDCQLVCVTSGKTQTAFSHLDLPLAFAAGDPFSPQRASILPPSDPCRGTGTAKYFRCSEVQSTTQVSCR